MALGKDRRIDIDIVANDKSSRVFDEVGRSMNGMALKINNGIISIDNALHRYNSAMNGMYRGTQVAIAGTGYLLYKFTNDAVRSFAEFERQHGKTMGAIASNYDRTADSQRKFLDDQRKLKEESLKLGTVGPTGKGALFNPLQVSYAQTALAKAGVTPANMSQSLPTILKFAGGNDLNIDTATDYAVNLQKMFDVPTEQLGKMLDEVTRAADISTIDVPDIFESLKYAGPIASSMNRPLEEVLGLITTMGNVGLKGSMAGTGIQSFFTRLLAPIGRGEASMSSAPSEYAESMFKAFVSDTTTKEGKFKPTVDITAELDDVMNALNDQEQAWFAYKLFGLFQMKSGFTLAKNGGDQLQGVIDDITNNSPGTNDRKWDLMLDTSYGKQAALGNAMYGIKTDVGYRLSPITNEIADQLFQVLANKGNYKINFDKLKNAINSAGDMIGEQYGSQLGGFVRGLGALGLKLGRSAIANEPLAEGVGAGLMKLLGGDFKGAFDEMSKAIDKANKNIDGLPPELQTFAREVKNASLALMTLAGINFTARLMESATTIWRGTIGQVIKAANMNVTATQVVLTNTGVVDKNGNPIFKATTETTTAKGGGTGKPPTIPPSSGSGKILGPDGKPIGGATATPKGGTYTSENGTPLEGQPPVAGSTTPKKSTLGKGLNTASWIYSLGEMFGFNDKLLDKAGVEGKPREYVDKARNVADWALTGSFVDDLVLKGIGKKTLMNIGKGAINAGKGIVGGGIVGLGAFNSLPLELAVPLAGGVFGAATTIGIDKYRTYRNNSIINAANQAGHKWTWNDSDPWPGDNPINDITEYMNKYRNPDDAAYRYPESLYPARPTGLFNSKAKAEWDETIAPLIEAQGKDRQQYRDVGSMYEQATGQKLPYDLYNLTRDQWGGVGTPQDVLSILDKINTAPTVNVAAPNVTVDVHVDNAGNATVNKYIQPALAETVDDMWRSTRSRSGGR